MDEIILYPKKSANMQHNPYTLIASNYSRWGNNALAFLFGSGLCAWSSRMNYPSDSSLWIFCSQSSKQKILMSDLSQSTAAENQQWLKQNTQGQKTTSSFIQAILSVHAPIFSISSWMPPLIYSQRTVKCSDTLPVRLSCGCNVDLNMTSLLGLTSVI